MNNVILTGPTGSGKTTQAKAIIATHDKFTRVSGHYFMMKTKHAIRHELTDGSLIYAHEVDRHQLQAIMENCQDFDIPFLIEMDNGNEVTAEDVGDFGIVIQCEHHLATKWRSFYQEAQDEMMRGYNEETDEYEEENDLLTFGEWCGHRLNLMIQ